MLPLLEHNVDVDVRNSEYATPLHSAAFEGELEAIQILLAHGQTSTRAPDPSPADLDEWT